MISNMFVPGLLLSVFSLVLGYGLPCIEKYESPVEKRKMQHIFATMVVSMCSVQVLSVAIVLAFQDDYGGLVFCFGALLPIFIWVISMFAIAHRRKQKNLARSRKNL